jgi:hypothetical protein
MQLDLYVNWPGRGFGEDSAQGDEDCALGLSLSMNTHL